MHLSFLDPFRGKLSRYIPEPLRRGTLHHYYNASRDIGDCLGQSMRQGTSRPARTVGMTAHKLGHFSEAKKGEDSILKRQ